MTRPFSLWLLGCLILTGCGGHPVAKVTGTVTYQNQPLEFGKIHFVPVDSSLPPAQGTIEKGEYTLEMRGDRQAPVSGIYTGEYRVWIACYPYHKPGWSGNSMIPHPPLIPKKYESVHESGLTATVVRGKNQIDFTLEKDSSR
ncbi:MAG: hypothetical protein Q4D62_02425 [Planctomycetia bacterium]|nr:hypothetical protein [Planctomycetia bacterium]